MHEPQLVPLLIFGTVMAVAFGVAAIMYTMIQKRKEMKARLERQRLEFEYSQTLLQTKIEVQETTLNMIAQELHDNIVQSLTACQLQIRTAADSVRDKEGRTLMQEATQSVKGVTADVRLLSHSLSTGLAGVRDTEDAIRAELRRIEAFSKICCTVHSDTVHELNPEQRLLLFRIVQEALQNILKHAQAKNIIINISAQAGIYRLAVTDDGIGFNPENSFTSLGLMNIKARARMLRGTLSIASTAGKGTTLAIELPVNHGHGKDSHRAG